MGKNKFNMHNPFNKHIAGKSSKDYMFWDSEQLNEISIEYYLSRLSELAMSMFEWKNLPKSIDERFLEYTLFYEGDAVFFKDTDLTDEQNLDGTYLALQCVLGGRLDVYRVPRDRKAYAVSGYIKKLTETDSVIIWNNMLRIPEYGRMLFYARKLYEIDRSIDVNVKNQKFPVAILCDENERLTFKNIYMQYDGNQPFLFGSKDLDLSQIQVLKTDAPYVCDKLYQLKNEVWNEALTCLGISNVNVQKKERLVSDEVVRGMGGTIASRHSRLEMRRRACEQINNMFGLNIDVDYREDYRELDDEYIIKGMTEGEGVAVMQNDIRTRNNLKG